MRDVLKDWAYERLFHGESSNLEHFNKQELLTFWTEHQTGKANHSWAFWKWISLNEWFDMQAAGELRQPKPESNESTVSKAKAQ